MGSQNKFGIKVTGVLVGMFLATATSGCDGTCDCEDSGCDEEDADTQGDDTGDDDTGTGEDEEGSFTFTPSNIAIDPGMLTGSDVLFQGSGCANNAEINTDSCEVDCLDGVVCEIMTQTDDSEVAVVFAREFLVADDVRLKLSGGRPLVIVATDDVQIKGTILAIDAIQNEDGAAGGYSCTGDFGPFDGNGPGGGGSSLGGVSAGGGGYCGVGGDGGSPLSADDSVGEGGSSYGNDTIVPLNGGSAGAKNEIQSGGAGGGAIQIVSAVSIVVDEFGVINMSGNGGDANSGTGGGAGGAILLEALEITVIGALAANGGSGGAGALYGDGFPGDGSDQPVPGGSSDNDANGGAGAAGDLINGSAGEDQINSGTVHTAGGGGGAMGWIRLNTGDGLVDVSGIVSPYLDTNCASAGMVNTSK